MNFVTLLAIINKISNFFLSILIIILCLGVPDRLCKSDVWRLTPPTPLEPPDE